MSMRRILLAEDSANDVELTLGALRQVGIGEEVVVARDGAEALDCLYGRGSFATGTHFAPIAVLLDLKLPKVAGLEILKLLKSDLKLRHLPVIILTSSREENDVAEGYRLGANAFVVKPTDFQQFTECVRQLGFFWGRINEAPPRFLIL